MTDCADVSCEAVGSVAVVRFQGEIDLATAEHARRQALAAILRFADHCTAVALDVSGLTYLDSSGLRMLEDVREASTARTLPAYVIAPVGCRARRLFDVTGLTAHLATRDDVAALHQERASEGA
jgi:anti-anti-sigma factor